jgi:hypothetical protein
MASGAKFVQNPRRQSRFVLQRDHSGFLPGNRVSGPLRLGGQCRQSRLQPGQFRFDLRCLDGQRRGGRFLQLPGLLALGGCASGLLLTTDHR